MNHCPDCGAELQDGTASFCPVCEKQIQLQDHSVTNNPEPDSGSGSSWWKKKRNRTKAPKASKGEQIPEVMGEPVDDGYDGYYNDVLPPDWDRVSDGIDKELIRKVIALIACVTLIILMCVGLLFVV